MSFIKSIGYFWAAWLIFCLPILIIAKIPLFVCACIILGPAWLIIAGFFIYKAFDVN